MSIEIRDLHFGYKYPQLKVLENINLTIKSGEIVALMGASGSGKSTLIKLISSFLKPTKGEIDIWGQQVLLNHPFHSIAYVSQSSIKTLFPWMNVEQNIYYPSKLRNQFDINTKQYCDELLSLLGIEHRRKSFPLKLSGGEQKRLSLALSLSYKPEVILMDEPFSGIDFKHTEKLWDILYKDFLKRKPTVLFVTHSLDEASLLANRVIYINRLKTLTIPEKGVNDFEKSTEVPRYGLLAKQSVTFYKKYLLDQFNLAMNG